LGKHQEITEWQVCFFKRRNLILGVR
jgi:hypothetical protein